jgi:hypothetical protein
MSDVSEQEPQGEVTDNTPQGEEEVTTQAETPQGETDESHDSTDWKAEARKWQKRAKQDAERLKAAEAKVKSLFSPEEVQTKEQALEAAQKQIIELQTRDLKRSVCAEFDLPPTSWEFIQGANEDEIRESASALKALVKSPKTAADAKKAMLQETPDTPPNANDLLRQIIASR